LDGLQTVRLGANVGITELAKRSLTSDALIGILERRPVGGVCSEAEAIRLAQALNVNLSALGFALL
jgi:hypothetical protein